MPKVPYGSGLIDRSELEIQGGILGRPESPVLEKFARLAIEAATRELITSRFLYQKVSVDLDQLPDWLAEARVEPTLERVAALKQEITLRPWKVLTEHLGDDPATISVMHRTQSTGAPLNTPAHEMSLSFFAPTIDLWCPQVCKRSRSFSALVSSQDRRLVAPRPKLGSKGTEQIFVLDYRCASCRQANATVLLRREGLRIHLCGFSPRKEPKVPDHIPDDLRPIASDALSSVAEGDLYAGFYHLRTLVEHYIKQRLQLALSEQIRGDELCDRYKESLPTSIRAAVPSLAPVHVQLSENLHARGGDAEYFEQAFNLISDHIQAVALLSRY